MKKVIMSAVAAIMLAGASVYATNSINHKKTDNTNAKTACCCPACPGCDDCACCSCSCSK